MGDAAQRIRENSIFSTSRWEKSAQKLNTWVPLQWGMWIPTAVSYHYVTGENHKYGYRNLWCGVGALHLPSFLNKYQWRIHVIFVYEWPVFLMKLRFGEERTASLSKWMFVSSSKTSPKSVLYLGNYNTLHKATLIHEMPHIVSCLGPDWLFWKAYSMDVICFEHHEMLVSGDA